MNDDTIRAVAGEVVSKPNCHHCSCDIAPAVAVMADDGRWYHNVCLEAHRRQLAESTPALKSRIAALESQLAQAERERDEARGECVRLQDELDLIGSTSLVTSLRQTRADLAAAREEARKWEWAAWEMAAEAEHWTPEGPRAFVDSILARYQPADDPCPDCNRGLRPKHFSPSGPEVVFSECETCNGTGVKPADKETP